MKNTIYLLVSIMCLCTVDAISQHDIVNIGSKLPDYTITNLINYRNSSAKFSAFKGKVLILDFWEFGCAGCIESWPKLMEIQNEFGNQIQIIIVNPRRNPSETQEFIRRWEKNKNTKLTLISAAGDMNLKSMFPHEFVPHLVWVNQDQVVKNITTSVDFTRQSVQSFINGESLKVPEKTDKLIDFQYSKPLYINGNASNDGVANEVMFSTVITPWSSKFPTRAHVESSKNGSWLFFSNVDITNTLMTLFGKGHSFQDMVPHSQIAFKNVDTTKIVDYVNRIYNRDNLYTFQITSESLKSIQEMKSKMISDIEFYFGIKAYWRKQKKKCLVFSRSEFPITPPVSKDTSLFVFQNRININNIKIPKLINYMHKHSHSKTDYPILDETNYPGFIGGINYTLKGYFDDHDLDLALRKHGLRFTVAEREVDVLIIDGSNSNFAKM